MGWGESQGRSAEMVVRADRLRKADALAAAVRAWRDRPSTGNAEHLGYALSEYELAR